MATTADQLKTALDALLGQTTLDVPIQVYLKEPNTGSMSMTRIFKGANATTSVIVQVESLEKLLKAESCTIELLDANLDPVADKGMLLRFLTELAKLTAPST